jgi:hypothetical protein
MTSSSSNWVRRPLWNAAGTADEGDLQKNLQIFCRKRAEKFLNVDFFV